MASNHLEIGSGTRLAAETRACIDQAQAVTDKIRELRSAFAEFASDWTALAAQLNVSEADAQNIYNNFTNAKTLLDDAGWGYFLNRMS